jgi:hypothetical protein
MLLNDQVFTGAPEAIVFAIILIAAAISLHLLSEPR